MEKKRRLILGLVALGLIGSWLAGSRYYSSRSKAPLQPFSGMVSHLNEVPGQELCDRQLAKEKLRMAGIVDRYRPQIAALWEKREPTAEPKFSVLSLGKVKLRISPPIFPKAGFETSAWSWEDAAGLFQKIWLDPGLPEAEQRWRDLDSIIQYLLEKDFLRLARKQEFLVPAVAKHNFRPDPSVTRSGPREFTVRLAIGEFQGYEKELQALLESEWQGSGYRVRVAWAGAGESGVYALRAIFTANRSFVNHKRKVMEIANLAWTKTVAHELGHILGFDDHYYSVWNARNCYYTQESRVEDLMSNSERGGVTRRHWQLLDQAYPWQKPGAREPFVYQYGK